LFIFISYSHVDRDLACSIADCLKRRKIPCFLDERAVDWGAEISQEIMQALGRATHLIVIVSQASLQSSWVAYEIGQAQGRGVATLPFVIDESLNRPEYLSSLKYVSSLDQMEAYLDSWDTGRLHVTIGSPLPGDRSPHTVQLEGTVSGLPRGFELWIVKEPHKGNYHPDRGPAVIDGDRWFGVAFVGNANAEADSHTEFFIHVVAASHETGRRYNDYIDRAHRTNGWMGINTLYDGQIVASTRVFRDNCPSDS
jgi:hypothetical protein